MSPFPSMGSYYFWVRVQGGWASQPDPPPLLDALFSL